LALQLAKVGERGERLRVLIPAGVESEQVGLEYALKQPNHMVAAFHDQSVLRLIAAENSKAEPLVKDLRRLDIFDRQANRESAQFHHLLLSFFRHVVFQMRA